jgi:hypothetical protein
MKACFSASFSKPSTTLRSVPLGPLCSAKMFLGLAFNKSSMLCCCRLRGDREAAVASFAPTSLPCKIAKTKHYAFRKTHKFVPPICVACFKQRLTSLLHGHGSCKLLYCALLACCTSFISHKGQTLYHTSMHTACLYAISHKYRLHFCSLCSAAPCLMGHTHQKQEKRVIFHSYTMPASLSSQPA